MNIDIPEQILRQTTRFRFDIRGCDGQTHHGYEQRAISSDEFRVSTSTMRIAFRDAEDDQTEDDQTLTVGSKTGIGIGVGLAVITFVSTVDGDEDERSTRISRHHGHRNHHGQSSINNSRDADG